MDIQQLRDTYPKIERLIRLLEQYEHRTNSQYNDVRDVVGYTVHVTELAKEALEELKDLAISTKASLRP